MMILALAAWPGSSVFRLSLRNFFTQPLGLGLLGFILWSLLACLWSVNLWPSLLEVFKVALVTGFGLILVLGLRKQCEDEKVRGWIQSGVVIGTLGIAFIFLFKIIRIAADESWHELLDEGLSITTCIALIMRALFLYCLWHRQPSFLSQ